MTLISLKDITKSYLFDKEHYQVLKGINLEIQQGEFLSIVGPSGSGKSTLLKIMGLLDIPTSGSIKIDKIDCSKIGENKQTILRRDFIGFIIPVLQFITRFHSFGKRGFTPKYYGNFHEKSYCSSEKII